MTRQNLTLFGFVLLIISCASPSPEITVEQIEIIPKPIEQTFNEGHFQLKKKNTIAFPDSFATPAEFLTEYLQPHFHFTKTEGEAAIQFVEDASITNIEGYNITIQPNQITVKASAPNGAFYAVQTLRQLLPPELENNTLGPSTLNIPTQRISDTPQFTYRGMHLDVCRHMFSVDFVKKYIDMLALLKLNTFHWHLTEDQGWRVQIDQYPKLNEIASFRKETLIGHYGDVPHQFDGQRYGGFYTKEEIKDIVAYAAERFITVIPEIEMPGHSQAVVAAYPELGCTGNQVEVATKWGVFEHIYCSKEETFLFLENVLDEVVELFPSEYIHIGGDEAPKTNWKACANCQKRIKDEGLKDEHELQSYFIKRMENYLNSKGKQIIGWDEILEGGLAPNATVMSWRGEEGGIAAAKTKHNVVMTPTSHLYFDYYQAEPENEPIAIGGFLPLEKVYAYNPIPEELTAEEAQYILGAQGNVWTEYMKDEDKVEYMAFPRMTALAEVVWTPAQEKNFEDYSKRMDALDINYHKR